MAKLLKKITQAKISGETPVKRRIPADNIGEIPETSPKAILGCIPGEIRKELVENHQKKNLD